MTHIVRYAFAGTDRAGMISAVHLSAIAGILLLAAGLETAAQAQQSKWRLKGAMDGAHSSSLTDAMRALNAYADCVVRRRYERARAFVLAPEGSEDRVQAMKAVMIRGGYDDGCLDNGQAARMHFNSSILEGALSRALLLRDYPGVQALLVRTDVASIPPPVSGSDAFGRCLIERDASAVVSLIRSLPGTENEMRQLAALRDDLGPCVTSGQQVTLNRLYIRNATASAAYRMAVARRPSRAPSGASR